MPITLHKEQMEEMWLDSLLEHGDCFNLDYNNMHIFLSTSLWLCFNTNNQQSVTTCPHLLFYIFT